MSNPAQLEEGSLKTPPKIYSLSLSWRRGGLVSPRMQPARRVHRCSRAGCSIDPDHYIMYFTFLGSPKAKLSIAAARRPVFVSTLQHCRLGKFGAAELARRFSVKGRVPCSMFWLRSVDFSSMPSIRTSLKHFVLRTLKNEKIVL
jgi:hypothetical protein